MTTIAQLLQNGIRTRDQLDDAAKSLSAIWDESFSPAPSFEGKKKNKLRDVVSKMFGYNGYQGFLAHLESLSIPTTTKSFYLPDEIVVRTTSDAYTDLLVIGTPQRDNEYLWGHDEHALYTIYDELSGDDELQLVGTDDKGIITPLRDLPLWQYICEHYECKGIEVIMPNIEKFGMCDAASDRGGLDFITNMFLTDNNDFTVTPIDRCDDGSESIIIQLVKKGSVQ